MRWIPILLISIGYLVFLINWVADKEKSFINDYISYYANSKYNFLTKYAFVITGFGVALTSNIFIGQITILNILLLLYGILLIILGLFPVDTKEAFTIKGIIHNISAHLCFDSFVIVFFYLIITGNRKEFYTLILIPLSTLSGILILLLPNKIKGLLQKISITSQLLLIIILLIDKKIPEIV